MNHAVFAGRVGKDGEIRFTKSGKQLLSFSLAVDTFENGEKGTLWVDCTMWGDRVEKQAGIVRKGAALTVSGDVGVRAYLSHGEARAQLLCTVYKMTLQSSPERAEDRQQSAPAATAPAAQQEAYDDEIPF